MAKSNLIKDMTGLRFTRITVVSQAESDRNGNARWNCLCDCGNTTVSHGFSLRNGAVKSCGCLTTDQLKERMKLNHRHDEYGTTEYMTWAHMLQRCTNPKSSRYARYGGRGIKVCERWYDFVNFFADMGKKPTPKHTLERIDNDGNYEPGNVKWATKAEQNHNKCNNHYVVYRDQRMTLTQAMELAGTNLTPGAVNGRLKRGWDLARALDTPPNPNIWTHAAMMARQKDELTPSD